MSFQLQDGDFHRHLLEVSPDGFVIISPEGRVLWANSRALEMYGFSTMEEAMDERVNAFDLFVEGPMKDLAMESVQRIISEGASLQGSYMARMHDGTTFPVEISARALIDDEGHPSALLASIRNDSERHAVLEELDSERRLLKTIINAIPDEIYVKDRTGRFILVNNACVRALRQDVEADVVGKHDRDLITSEFAGLAEQEERQLLETGVPILNHQGRMRVNPATGEVERSILISKIPLREHDGRITGLVGINRDVTDWRRAEAALIHSQRRLALAIEGAHCGIIDWDLDADNVTVNEQLCEILGLPREDLEGRIRKYFRRLHPDDINTIRDIFTRVLGGDMHRFSLEMRLLRGDGSWIWINIAGMVISHSSDDDRATRLTGIVLDITDRKHAEFAMVHAKERAERSDRIKDAFIANISHEIRTPLNTITGYTQFLQELFADRIRESEHKYFDNIQRGSERLMRTVDEILSFSRIQSGELLVELQETDLHALLSRVLSDIRPKAHKKGLTLSYVNECGHIDAPADEYYLSQAVLNLLDNAIKYTSAGGVTVRMFRAEPGMIGIEVRDTGIGISEEYLPNLFEPYSQEEIGHSRAYDGIGLGLALVKKYLEFHGAEIHVASEKGAGSAFTVLLRSGEPVPVRRPSDAAPAPHVRPRRKHKPCVLIVEDDEMTIEYLTLILGDAYAVAEANSAADAWKVLRRRQVDVVLMDISLRGKKTGIDLTREIRSSDRFGALPVIALTAHAFPTDRDECIAAGCNDFIAKPAGKALLLDSLERLLATRED
ncbi:MAG: PAS domain S-box protein [Ignavibacteriae bacterium]|nr:PAS domain S-box protein [Ignavibacteriota bacterium]